jgi:ribonuclease Z
MAKLIILGTANAIPSSNQDGSHMVLVGASQVVLIDVSTNPIIRLRQAEIDPLSLTDLILTHFHPDHVSGVPLLLLDSWLLGRKAPLNIYGLAYTLERVQKMMDLFNWQDWPGFFPVNFHPIMTEELTEVIHTEEFRILASPVKHLIPNIGLRIEICNTGQSLAYSCDTAPCQEVIRLASGVNYLLHEATGEELGHSSAAAAGNVAAQAGADNLLLIHYDLGKNLLDEMLAQARAVFPGNVELARDFQVIEFS